MSASMRRVRVVQWLGAAVLVSMAALGVDAVGDVLRAVLLAGLADLVEGPAACIELAGLQRVGADRQRPWLWRSLRGWTSCSSGREGRVWTWFCRVIDVVGGVVPPGGLRLRLLVILSFQSIFGDGVGGGATAGAGSVRFIYSFLEESGWSCSLLVASELLAILGAPDLFLLDDRVLVHSAIKVCIDFFGAPHVAKDGLKSFVTSSEVSSSSWSSASSCKLDSVLFQGCGVRRRLRRPATKATGNVIQEPGCSSLFLRGVLVSFEFNFYINKIQPGFSKKKKLKHNNAFII